MLDMTTSYFLGAIEKYFGKGIYVSWRGTRKLQDQQCNKGLISCPIKDRSGFEPSY